MRAKTRLQFLGGVAGVNLTGSCYLLEIEQGKRRTKILIDIGLVQCGFRDSLEKNQAILQEIDPKKIDFIILTHSHIDHVGRLPLLAKYGFAGRIICTEGTRYLIRAMLDDSAKIQMNEAGYNNARALKDSHSQKNKGCSRDLLTRGNFDRIKRKNKKQNGKAHHQPLYGMEDVETVDGLIKNGGFEYYEWIRLTHGISLKFYPSGHVMGGGIVVIKLESEPKDIQICFSGDLGRNDGVILPPPELVDEEIDYLILESTYGGKRHPDQKEEVKKMLDLVKRAAKNDRKIIIPSFALERVQEMIYRLSCYMQEGEIPVVPIFLDSPLAAKITSAFSKGWRQGMFVDQERLAFNPFDPEENPYFQIVSGVEESNALIAKAGKHIIIAGSGMCDAGRIRGYLRANLSKASTIVALVGYMVEGSLGRKLKDGLPSVRMNDEEIIVQAEIISFESFSAHADGAFLAAYAQSVIMNNNTDGNRKIFLVHGEGESALNLKADIENSLPENLSKKVKIMIPKINQKEEII